MQEFDELKHLWQQETPKQFANYTPDTNKAATQTKQKLQNEQLKGSVCLVLTAVFIAALAIWGNFNFEHWYTYGAMALVSALCLAQAAIMFYTYQQVKQIDETAVPKQHLSQWEVYYAFRKKLLRWNKPLYFILLNLALGLYFIEVMAGASAQFLLGFGIIYFGWMIFAYFFMGRRLLKKERKRIESMIQELKQLERQFTE
ncbi:hypothetical protein [Pontibacter sp. H249]|uniref:hypothetical protein n=1 Tax=Pontibacter sp. H249 TaxID=3133420 RepID=UPI0030BBFDFC